MATGIVTGAPMSSAGAIPVHRLTGILMMRAGSPSDTGCVQDCKPSSCNPMRRQPLAGTCRDIACNSVRSDWRKTDRAPPFRNAGPRRIRKAQLPEKRSFFAPAPPFHRDIAAASRTTVGRPKHGLFFMHATNRHKPPHPARRTAAKSSRRAALGYSNKLWSPETGVFRL